MLEARLVEKFKSIPKNVTPGFRLSIVQNGKKKAEVNWGKVYPYYDLASLTKIFFTTSLLMKLVSEKKLSVGDPVKKYVPWFVCPKAKVKNLLNHTAGLTWWLPIYKKINRQQSISFRWLELQGILKKEGVKEAGNRSVYSDLDFFYLALVLEKIFDRPLSWIYQSLAEDSPVFEGLHFNWGEKLQLKYKKSQYAPTETCPWRKKTLQGEVHDDNTWALGGLSTHAGLFGGLDEVEDWFLAFRKCYSSPKNFLGIKPEVAKLFSRPSLARSRGDWGLGFMMPSKKGSSAGSYLSRNSIGHTGFTGTSFWWDQKKDLAIILLSNRVHPSRNHREFVKWRPKIHDIVYKELFA